MTKDDDVRKALEKFEREHGSSALGLHFNRRGESISFVEWAVLFEDKAYQIIVQTWTLHGAWVSTVWLGLDHNWRDDGAPVIFESMVWHDGNDTTQDRYSTEAAALAGHEAIVARYGGRDPNPPERPDMRAALRAFDALDTRDDDDDEEL